MTMEKLTSAERTEQVTAWKLIQYEANKDEIETYCECVDSILQAKKAAYNKVYNREHREENAAHNKVYRDENKESITAYRKVYNREHRDEKATYNRVYRREHPREKRAYLLAFSDPDCHVWNRWFEGCEGHHIACDEGVYIPKSLHRSLLHNLKTGHGMEEINLLAYNWLNGVCRTTPQATLDIF